MGILHDIRKLHIFVLFLSGSVSARICACRNLRPVLIIPDKQAVPRGYPQVPHHRTFRQDILPSEGSYRDSFRSRGQRHPEHLLKQRDDVRRLIIAGEKQVESGATSHRTEVENFIFVKTMIS